MLSERPADDTPGIPRPGLEYGTQVGVMNRIHTSAKRGLGGAEPTPPTPAIPTVELTDDDVALALRNPLAARERCARRVWPHEMVDEVGPDRIPLRVARPSPPLSLPRPEVLWHGAAESIVWSTAEDLVELIHGLGVGPVGDHIAPMPADALRSYLRMTVVRVVRVIEALRERGFESSTVLEVGAWFGSFSLALRRLGYDVVACDRYASYGTTFEGCTELMSGEGVRIVSTTRADELRRIRDLGWFDVVLAGAVIEHVPDTPRLLLETLCDAVRPGGLLVIDTPNLTRYWNRRALERGESIFQPLEAQYACTPPWEGHHREYTARELRWLLERVGCHDVDVGFLDYNMLQFDELWGEHVECLATIVEDPSQSDVILGVGMRP